MNMIEHFPSPMARFSSVPRMTTDQILDQESPSDENEQVQCISPREHEILPAREHDSHKVSSPEQILLKKEWAATHTNSPKAFLIDHDLLEEESAHNKHFVLRQEFLLPSSSPLRKSSLDVARQAIPNEILKRERILSQSSRSKANKSTSSTGEMELVSLSGGSAHEVAAISADLAKLHDLQRENEELKSRLHEVIMKDLVKGVLDVAEKDFQRDNLLEQVARLRSEVEELRKERDLFAAADSAWRSPTNGVYVKRSDHLAAPGRVGTANTSQMPETKVQVDASQLHRPIFPRGSGSQLSAQAQPYDPFYMSYNCGIATGGGPVVPVYQPPLASPGHGRMMASSLSDQTGHHHCDSHHSSDYGPQPEYRHTIQPVSAHPASVLPSSWSSGLARGRLVEPPGTTMMRAGILPSASFQRRMTSEVGSASAPGFYPRLSSLGSSPHHVGTAMDDSPMLSPPHKRRAVASDHVAAHGPIPEGNQIRFSSELRNRRDVVAFRPSHYADGVEDSELEHDLSGRENFGAADLMHLLNNSPQQADGLDPDDEDDSSTSAATTTAPYTSSGPNSLSGPVSMAALSFSEDQSSRSGQLSTTPGNHSGNNSSTGENASDGHATTSEPRDTASHPQSPVQQAMPQSLGKSAPGDSVSGTGVGRGGGAPSRVQSEILASRPEGVVPGGMVPRHRRLTSTSTRGQPKESTGPSSVLAELPPAPPPGLQPRNRWADIDSMSRLNTSSTITSSFDATTNPDLIRGDHLPVVVTSTNRSLAKVNSCTGERLQRVPTNSRAEALLYESPSSSSNTNKTGAEFRGNGIDGVVATHSSSNDHDVAGTDSSYVAPPPPRDLAPQDDANRHRLFQLCKGLGVEHRTTEWFISPTYAHLWPQMINKIDELRRRRNGEVTVKNPAAWLTKFFNIIRIDPHEPARNRAMRMLKTSSTGTTKKRGMSDSKYSAFSVDMTSDHLSSSSHQPCPPGMVSSRKGRVRSKE